MKAAMTGPAIVAKPLVITVIVNSVFCQRGICLLIAIYSRDVENVPMAADSAILIFECHFLMNNSANRVW
jgi:hypothetical protein